jgi:hypothetical protein
LQSFGIDGRGAGSEQSGFLDVHGALVNFQDSKTLASTR